MSQNSVWCILRDKQGFMWFGTDDGLNKYDGYRVQVYRAKKNDSTTLAHNTVRALIQDREGLIWIGTSDGLNVFDPLTDRMTVYRASSNEPGRISSSEITSLAEDRDGSIWVGTRANGICRFDHGTHTFHCYKNSGKPGAPAVIGSNWISTVYIDRAGVLWAGTLACGISRYDKRTDSFTTFRAGDGLGAIPDGQIYSFFEDSKGRFWIGSQGAGIMRFDRKTGRCTRYTVSVPAEHMNFDSVSVLSITEDSSGKIMYATFGGGVKFLNPETGETTEWRRNSADLFSLGSDQVMALYPDSLHNLWIGTYTGGVCKYDPRGEHFQTYRNDNPYKPLLTNDNVRSLFRDKQGNIWIGTAKGLNILNPKTGVCEHYLSDPADPQSLAENFVSAIYEDRQGTMWIGTRKGFHMFDRKTKRFTRYLANPNDPNGLRNGYVRQILEDKFGIMWLATLDGLHVFDRKTRRFKSYVYSETDSTSISGNNVRSLYEDSSGTLWIGTYQSGFDKFDRTTETFTRFRHDPRNTNSVSSDMAAPITGDKDGNIWVGTYSDGLNKYDPKTGLFTFITENDGLVNNTIYSIQVSRKGKLWISTNSGISCYNPATHQFKNYTSASGLQGPEFNSNSYFKDADGTLMFGGTNGFNLFLPDQITDNQYVPPVYITSLSILNKPFKSDTAISMKKLIVLPYDENSLTFDFVSLNYRKPELNSYMYILDGFEKEWITAGADRRASYRNLPPGTYMFRVIGSNNDGIWNKKGAAISIVIKPPFWKTWWAYAIYALVVSGVFLLILMFVQRRERRRLMMEAQRHESELVRQKNVKLKEANDEILRHQESLRERSEQIERTNKELKEEIVERHRAEDRAMEALAEKEVLLKEIHHRVKNNLTIVGSLLGMQSDVVTNEHDRQLFHEAKNRVITMAQIHEKLYQSKNLADIEFGEYIRGVATQLFHAYNNGNASLRISAEKVKFGVDMAIPCGLIINELITNSLKYAFPDGAGGVVFIEVHSTPEHEYEVIVGDTGIGFSPSIDFRTCETMGLTLVRSLVRQLKGTIELDSDRGTKFMIRFPIEKD
ncbi:MAG TPA: two-component regulator propeller domain-containing protein [Bacteroidota bacterium]|nr:two-component regulator propeller domain-containing protein [Bacteroidota bacterium]